MDKNKHSEDSIETLMKESGVCASENLKHRVMQQIVTEASLAKKRHKTTKSLVGTLFSVLGVMYFIIAILGLGLCMTYGKEILKSETFYVPALLIATISSAYLLISLIDERRKR